ncbi:MAG: hypothetical protein HY327_06920 [Chloroflexi bacterium]|nr:hypothetical protein [Chloroflexota bacterium]
METLTKSPEAIKKRIAILLADFPPDRLDFVEQLVLFLHEQTQTPATRVTREKRAPYLYPTVPVSVTTLNAWMNLLPNGYEGDALADSEAVYEDAPR